MEYALKPFWVFKFESSIMWPFNLIELLLVIVTKEVQADRIFQGSDFKSAQSEVFKFGVSSPVYALRPILMGFKNYN